MDWRIFFTTFSMIFVAEMGDKTQFAALAASAGTKSTFSVMLAVVLALSLAGILGVIAGRILGDWLNAETVRWVSGGMFVVIGIWILMSK